MDEHDQQLQGKLLAVAAARQKRCAEDDGQPQVELQKWFCSQLLECGEYPVNGSWLGWAWWMIPSTLVVYSVVSGQRLQLLVAQMNTGIKHLYS